MEGIIKNGQSRDIGNIWHKTQNKDKQNQKYNTENQKYKQHGPHQKTGVEI